MAARIGFCRAAQLADDAVDQLAPAVHVLLSQLTERLKVGPRAEVALERAGQHQYPHLRIVCERVERVRRLADHRPFEGVHWGPVELDPTDGVLHRGPNEHGGLAILRLAHCRTVLAVLATTEVRRPALVIHGAGS